MTMLGELVAMLDDSGAWELSQHSTALRARALFESRVPSEALPVSFPDPSEPWPIPLPPEPPRDRRIEAVDAEGKVTMCWMWDGSDWHLRGWASAWNPWRWAQIAALTYEAGWDLRSVPTKRGEVNG